jgi:3-oxoacyl-[acyl-carrier-protein] synthase III
MHRFLFTIGFTGKSAEEFFALLRQAGVQTVIDVRQNRGGQLSAFAKHPDLEFFLEETAGISYRHEPLLAPCPELRKKYQSDNDWAAYEAEFFALMKERGVPQAVDTTAWPDKVALLCREAGPEKCHRRLAADLLAGRWRAEGDEVEIQHLIASKARGKGKAAVAQAISPIEVAPPRSASVIASARTSAGASAGGKISGVAIVGSAAALGSRRVQSEDVDRAFGMPLGKLRERAGIESLAYATTEQNELTLGAEALRQAMHVARCAPGEIDWVLATSETHREYPSLAAQLHKSVAARESCGALDVGGACLGLLNALAVAQSFMESGAARTVAIVTADVHSGTLSPRRVAGEFGGLFGDGASAFVLRAVFEGQQTGEYQLGKFVFGCASQYAEAICVADTNDGGLAVRFDGEALSRAAITRMERVIGTVETESGIARGEVGMFATHQPNPRLVALLAKQCGVAPAAFPGVARTAGNLGASTCGVALHTALQSTGSELGMRKPIFLASLGPGLLFGGGWLKVRSRPSL